MRLPRIVLTAVALLLGVMAAQPALAQNAAPSQIFYVPIPEDEMYDTLDSLYYSSCGNSALPDATKMQTYLSISVATDSTVIYYDQHENGYEVDIANPTNLYSGGNPGGTQIWGDGDTTNGAPPGYPGDILTSGDIIILNNVVDSTNLSAIDFDGSDKFGATAPVAVTRAGWSGTYSAQSGTLLAGAVEMFDTEQWGTSFVAPVGIGTPRPDGTDNQVFQYVGLAVMAAENGTVVNIDTDADGNPDITQTLNEGQTIHVDGGVAVGATVTSSGGPVQVDLLTGNICANYEMRWYALTPRDEWSTNYYAPVGTSRSSTTTNRDNTIIYVYNPDPNNALSVSYDFETGSTNTLNVPAGGTAAVLVTPDSAIHLFADAEFYAIAAIDAEASSSYNLDHDWGFPLIPLENLTTQVLVGWGVGKDPDSAISQNGSPIWVTPACTAEQTSNYIYVDFDNDGTPDKVDLNGDGDTTDTVNGISESTSNQGMSVTTLKSIRLFNPTGNDQTGAFIYTLDGANNSGNPGCKLAVAWGQDPRTANDGEPGIDLGTVIPPFPSFNSGKSAALAIDNNNNGLIDYGDTLRYQIDVINAGVVDLTTFTVADALPNGVTYVANSTYWTRNATPNPGSDTQIGGPDDGGVFPLDGAGASVTFSPAIGPDEKGIVYFDVLVNDPGFSGETLLIQKTGPTVAVPGDSIDFEIQVTNNFDYPVFEVTITDDVPTGMTIDSVTPVPASGNCSVVDQLVTCVFGGSLAPDAAVDVTISVTVNDDAPLDLSNTACVNSTIRNVATVSDGAQVDTSQADSTVQGSCDTSNTTLPVTIGYILATANQDGTTTFAWQTATETGNLGFNLWAEGADGLVKLNDGLIPSTVIDSVEPTDYHFTVSGPVSTFYIDDITLDGTMDRHGPFTVGVPVGSYIDADPVAPPNEVYLPYVLNR